MWRLMLATQSSPTNRHLRYVYCTPEPCNAHSTLLPVYNLQIYIFLFGLVSCYRTAWLVTCKAACDEGPNCVIEHSKLIDPIHWKYTFRAINLAACMLINLNVSIRCNFLLHLKAVSLFIIYTSAFVNDNIELIPM